MTTKPVVHEKESHSEKPGKATKQASPDGILSGTFEVNGASFPVEFLFKNMIGNVPPSQMSPQLITHAIESALQAKFGVYSVLSRAIE